MYNLPHFVADIRTIRKNFPQLTVEEFLEASCFGVAEQGRAFGGTKHDIEELQLMVYETLAPVSSYLFECEAFNASTLNKAERIYQHTLGRMGAAEKIIWGSFGIEDAPKRKTNPSHKKM